MMNNGSHTWEQPIVRRVLQHEDIFRSVVATQATPALGNERSHSGYLDSVKDHLCKLIRVINDNTSEANVDRRLPCVQEIC